MQLETIVKESAPLRSRIVASIRRAIETGVLKPGEKLVEKELCSQLGVSRTSLREAMRRLEAEGIIAQATTRGLTVAKISYRDAENIYSIRESLEALIIEQFIDNATEGELAVAEVFFAKLVSAYRAGTLTEIIDAKQMLYGHLCRVADNKIAHDLLARLTLRTSQLRSLSVARSERKKESAYEIETLAVAVLGRNVDDARSAVTVHVKHAARSALKFINTEATKD